MKLDFLPTYSYRHFVLGIVGVTCSVILFIAATLFNIEILNVEVIKWFVALFLTIIASSKDKMDNQDSIYLRYYAGKWAFTLLVCFCLAIRLTELLQSRNVNLDYVNLIILGLGSYICTYQILKILAQNSKVE